MLHKESGGWQFSRILYILLGSCLHSWLIGGKRVIFNDQNNRVSADILFKKYVQFNKIAEVFYHVKNTKHSWEFSTWQDIKLWVDRMA